LDGYIAHEFYGFKQKFPYDLGGARQKARVFGGKIEKFGKEYTLDIKKTIVILGKELEPQVVTMLMLQDEKILDAEGLGESIQRLFKCKTLKEPLTEESKTELICLIELIMMYDNVKIVWYQR
jgi:hypothetical protein